MAHITGGGIPGNVARIIPAGAVAKIDVSTWQVPAMFSYVVEAGNVSESESYRAFNMGIGFVIVCSQDTVPSIMKVAPDATVIGEIASTNDERRVILTRDGEDIE
jgi:phosphoribosylformylglycinamidine cyclo-ligase